ncbi:MAG: efflux RND transporter periplasmic adaptor subunit [Armatimonadetes bacterium]|nr:efflux RND transporter periplasmic adaptor subunit [Armatimonadota bacterium]
MKVITCLILFVVSVSAFAVDGVAGPYKVSLHSSPEVIPVGKARLLLQISDSQNKPVSKATVKVLAKMPGMSMGEREETASEEATLGTYSAPAVFAMAGSYDVSISILGPSGQGSTVLKLATGEAGGGSPGSPLWLYLLTAAILITFVLWRMRATGQKASLSAAVNRKTLLPLALLAAALLIAVWAVRSFRREGAMTPLEAQVMEMNTPAPEGVLPVTLAEAREQPFAEAVTYSGQVVGFVEQEVIPRVSGTIVSMPVYVGDKVRRGQLLARLDTSQIDPMIAEKAAGVSSASQGVSVADSEYSQSLNMVQQSQAEISIAQSEIAEARSMLDAAKAGSSSAESGVESASADARSADADLNAAQADEGYQRQELERMRTLYAKGAVSKDEWQQAQATAQKADAAVASAKERVTKANAMLRAAKSEFARASAEVAAATTRVQKAQANLKSKQAQAETAKSGVQSARAKIEQSRASVNEAAAGLKGATTQKAYAELRAEVDGVVTQRLISPGVVVNPGQSVLKIAQVSPVRLQANVPQQDLARIHVGDGIRVLLSHSDPQPLLLKVTSVSPVVDPASRMGTVEAIYDNKSGRFSPGQYVSLEIAVGSQASALVIPTEAIQTETQGTETLSYAWVATPSGGGEFTVARQEVQIGGRSGGFTAVRGGLKKGYKVVVSPYGLAAGSRIRPVEALAEPVNGAVTIEITEAGYTPSSIRLTAGKPTKLIFIRRIKDTCATSVDFPEIGLHAETPLNTPVTVVVPAQPAGKELAFTCPMNMYKGKAVSK